MCGIFGISASKDFSSNNYNIKKMIKTLFEFSELRGMEASGIAIKSYKKNKIELLRQSTNGAKFTKFQLFNNITDNIDMSQAFTILGHTRIATNGYLSLDNQPIAKNGAVGIHNGIICNIEELWKEHSNLKRKQTIDTELFFGLIKERIENNEGYLYEALNKTYNDIEGTASIGLMFDCFDGIILGTNCGSLYYSIFDNFIIFASEFEILRKTFQKLHLSYNNEIKQLIPLKYIYYDNINNKSIDISKVKDFKISYHQKFEIEDLSTEKVKIPYLNKQTDVYLKSILEYNIDTISKIKRCSKCILPETHPYINFDEKGICNYCRDYEKRKSGNLKNGLKELEKILIPIKEKDGINCIVMLSGGRDSCYALHYVKKILGLNPIAFSYDWGMLTDLGRRNQARMCQKLGVEHIVVSADIKLKRRNIRLNVNAFLSKPHLGMIGLFMAGDKAYHYFAKQISEEYKLPLINGGSPFEYTYFKEGFAQIKPSFMRTNSLKDKLSIPYFFAKQTLYNIKFINCSIFDNILAYYHYYLNVLDSIKLFRFIKWDENEINNTLVNEYNWEVAPDTTTTWRIGDGTAAFYNYIYYTVAGFTENDCLRSNLINEGVILREDALKLANEENKPRLEALRWYCDTIGIDLKKAISIINNIPKSYQI